MSLYVALEQALAVALEVVENADVRRGVQNQAPFARTQVHHRHARVESECPHRVLHAHAHAAAQYITVTGLNFDSIQLNPTRCGVWKRKQEAAAPSAQRVSSVRIVPVRSRRSAPPRASRAASGGRSSSAALRLRRKPLPAAASAPDAVADAVCPRRSRATAPPSRRRSHSVSSATVEASALWDSRPPRQHRTLRARCPDLRLES